MAIGSYHNDAGLEQTSFSATAGSARLLDGVYRGIKRGKSLDQRCQDQHSQPGSNHGLVMNW